jgi:MFS family permease
MLTIISRPAMTRTRAMPALFTGAALINAAVTTASPVATIAAADRLGTGWGGLPNMAAIAGTGLGAALVTVVMSRQGRRAGLVLGYLAATVGAALAAFAVARDDIAGLGLGMLFLGLGNAGAGLSRYVAAELYPPQRHGFAISMLTWAGTVGAVGGPLLLGPTAAAAAAVGCAALLGPFLFAALAAGLAAIAAAGAPDALPHKRSQVKLRPLLAMPAVRSAFAVMATAQLVMVAVMTAAPLDMHLHGHTLSAVGAVLAAHTLGMFALSPLTGRLVDHLGTRSVMLSGLLTLTIAAALVAAGTHTALRAAALFLLGYGWNLCFIAGSTRLARNLPQAQRAQVEGAVDSGVWTVAAAAGLASTTVLAIGGYLALVGLAVTATLLPALLLKTERQGGAEDEPAPPRHRTARPRPYGDNRGEQAAGNLDVDRPFVAGIRRDDGRPKPATQPPGS